MKLFSRFRKQKPVNPPVVAPEPPNLKRVKILILGTLGSGKSTFMKNFAFTKIHTSRPEEQKKEDIKTTTPSVLANVLYMFFNAGKEYFAENQDKKGTPLWNEYMKICEIAESESYSIITAASRWTPDVHNAVLKLYENPQFHTYLVETATFSDLNIKLVPRVLEKNPVGFKSSLQDAIICRMKSVGITERTLLYKGVEWQTLDVGGARNERKKWIHHFEDTNFVMFTVSLTDFNSVCYEDDITNRMLESLDLWEEMTNGRFFSNTRFMLVFSKIDLFLQFFHKLAIRHVLHEYTLMNQVDALKFIAEKFLGVVKENRNRITVHLCDFTDEKQTWELFDVMQEIRLLDANENRTYSYFKIPRVAKELSIVSAFHDITIN